MASLWRGSERRDGGISSQAAGREKKRSRMAKSFELSTLKLGMY